MRPLTFLFFALTLTFASTDAHAYVGPGLGLGALGAVLAVVVSVFVGLAAIVWYPIKRRMKKRKAAADANQGGDDKPA